MMSTPRPRSRRGLIWAVIGGAVLVIAIAAVVVSPLLAQSPPPDPTPSTPSTDSPTVSPSQTSDLAYVDPSVVENGWVPEPITTDADTYIRAALAAASTFDTTKSSRPDWLAYLDTWFTPDTRYTSEQDRQDDMQASQLEMRQGVVLPEEEWDSLANEKGRVAGAVTGDITYKEVPDDASGAMRIGTADVVLTYTRSDGGSGETSYEETARVSVQVLCGEGSVPTPNTSQQAGDCKVVRYFSGSLEP